MTNNINISGFTFIKNGLSLGYPFAEAIKSIEPLCDEIIINVGFDDPNLKNDDGTLSLIEREFSGSKFKIIKNYWDPDLTAGGTILSQQTNLALEQCQGKVCQYIQGDEAIHQHDFPLLRKAYDKLINSDETQGILFDYLHFYGNTNIIKKTRNVYRREIRAIKNGQGIKSWLDAQGFKSKDEQKLPCIKTEARVFHYGWARPVMLMDRKNKAFAKLYHGQEHQEKDFHYKRIWGLRPYSGDHPQVMENWIEENKYDFDISSLPLDWSVKDLRLMVSDTIESITGIRIGEYKNYKIIDQL